MPALIWAGFLLSLLVLMGVARFSLWGAMAAAALLLGLFTLPLGALGAALWEVLGDPSVMLLALAVSFIPLIGGALEKNGYMASLVANLRIGRRAFYGLSPAILGMLPMPGGALLSSPLLERAGGAPPELRAAANVWFRHALLLVYPISSSLIATSKLAGLDVWQVIPYQFPALVLAVALGYVFLLRRVQGDMEYEDEFSPAGLLVPLGVILVAPALDFALKRAVSLPVPEIATLTGVGVSLILAGRGLRPAEWAELARRARPWRFGLIVVGMFLYIAVFQRSGAPDLMATLPLSPQVLGVGLAAFLGLATGRIQAPASIVIPVYLAQQGPMSPWAFAVVYFSVYIGYILSPVHPCVSVSVEYAGTTLGRTLRTLLCSSLVALSLAALAGLWLL